MTVADIYLICFIVGFATTVIAALSGTHHFHLPGFHGHGVHIHHGHGFGSVFSFGNLAAFLTWFGGVGYLLTRFSTVWFLFAFMLAIVAGVLGGAIIFLFSMKLLSYERPLNPVDFEMVGVLGHLTSAIREGGIGEISFSQTGTRRSAPARSDDGSAMSKNTEVLVTRYEKGIAYVRRWDELSDSFGSKR